MNYKFILLFCLVFITTCKGNLFCLLFVYLWLINRGCLAACTNCESVFGPASSLNLYPTQPNNKTNLNNKPNMFFDEFRYVSLDLSVAASAQGAIAVGRNAFFPLSFTGCNTNTKTDYALLVQGDLSVGMWFLGCVCCVC